MQFTRDGLKNDGYMGFISVAELQRKGCPGIPKEGGVYIMLRVPLSAPIFLNKSTGGWFKKKDPTVPQDVLQENWVEGTPTLYIGKGNDLQRRLRQFLRFGAGDPVGHWGGRMVWQMAGAEKFLIAWKEEAQPRSKEKQLLREFEATYGQLPFANLKH